MKVVVPDVMKSQRRICLCSFEQHFYFRCFSSREGHALDSLASGWTQTRERPRMPEIKEFLSPCRQSDSRRQKDASVWKLMATGRKGRLRSERASQVFGDPVAVL